MAEGARELFGFSFIRTAGPSWGLCPWDLPPWGSTCKHHHLGHLGFNTCVLEGYRHSVNSSRLYSTVDILVFCCCCNNYHMLSGLSSMYLLWYSSAAQKSNTGLIRLKSGVRRTLSLSGSLCRGESDSLSFPASSGQPQSLVHGLLPPHLLSQHGLIFLTHCHLSLSNHSWARFPAFKDYNSVDTNRIILPQFPYPWSHLQSPLHIR